MRSEAVIDNDWVVEIALGNHQRHYCYKLYELRNDFRSIAYYVERMGKPDANLEFDISLSFIYNVVLVKFN
jgi:hypothetical protein